NYIELSMYAALIFISVQVLRVPVGMQFIHLGNALVVIAVLIYGSKKGALVASLGLGIFDVLNGYASVVWITILESLAICLILHLVYERAMQSSKKPKAIITITVIAALSKLTINLIKYLLLAYIGTQLPLSVSFWVALGKIGGSFGTSFVTLVAVPLLYPVIKNLKEKVTIGQAKRGF
ncbi:TPA: ECF transporter S component, partial [Streptococcus pyogenes]